MKKMLQCCEGMVHISVDRWLTGKPPNEFFFIEMGGRGKKNTMQLSSDFDQSRPGFPGCLMKVHRRRLGCPSRKSSHGNLADRELVFRDIVCETIESVSLETARMTCGNGKKWARFGYYLDLIFIQNGRLFFNVNCLFQKTCPYSCKNLFKALA